MSLASPCQESMRGDDNSYQTSSWYRGNLSGVPEISRNMGMQYMPGGIGLNLQRGWGNSFRSCSTDLSPKQNANFAIDHTSTTGERSAGTLKMIDQRSPISPLSPQGIGSDGLPQTSQSQRLYSSERNQMNDDLIHSSSHNHGSFNDQVYIHESFPCNNELSRESSICIQSSDGSPLSSQHSQSYSSDSRYFHSAEDAADLVGNAYSGNVQPANLKILEEIKTALLGPDGDDPVDMDYAYGDHTLNSNSEWSLEALSDFNDFLDQTSNPGYSQINNADSSRVPDNLQQLTNHGDRNVKEETVNEINLKIEHFSPSSSDEEKLEIEELGIPQGDVKSLLIECAKAIADGRNADNLIAGLRQVVNIYGDPLHRLAAYMVEGLVARLHFSGGHIYKTLKCKEPTSSELLSYMHILYEVCPYFKFGYVAANGAIAEAFKDKDRVHIIDFQIAQGSQWVTLIQAFAARQGGSPHVRITGVDDPQSEYARGQGLNLVGERLSKLAESYQVPFEFHGLSVFGSDVHAEMLEIRPGEALAVNFPLQLHHMPDESVNTSNHRDRLLRMVKNFSPNVVTLVEQEANTNTAPFFPRFMAEDQSDFDDIPDEDVFTFQSNPPNHFHKRQGSITVSAIYDSRTQDIRSSVVARGDLWRAEASHGGSSSGNSAAPPFLLQLGPILFVRDTTLLLPVHLSKQHFLWYGFDRKNGLHSLCPAVWSKHRRWLYTSVICLNPLACSFMDLQFPHGQVTYVAGEGLTSSAFFLAFGGLLQVQRRYPGETKLSFTCKNRWGTRMTPMVQWPDKSFSVGMVQPLAWQRSGLMVQPTIQLSVTPTFGGRNAGWKAELIKSVKDKLSFGCGCAFTVHPTAFASVSVGRSKWNGHSGSSGVDLQVECPLENIGRASFTIQLNSGLEF